MPELHVPSSPLSAHSRFKACSRVGSSRWTCLLGLGHETAGQQAPHLHCEPWNAQIKIRCHSNGTHALPLGKGAVGHRKILASAPHWHRRLLCGLWRSVDTGAGERLQGPLAQKPTMEPPGQLLLMLEKTSRSPPETRCHTVRGDGLGAQSSSYPGDMDATDCPNGRWRRQEKRGGIPYQEKPSSQHVKEGCSGR